MDDFIPKCTVLDVINSEKLLNSWTGIPTFMLLDAIQSCVNRVRIETLTEENGVISMKEKIMLAFVKLKTNLTFICMSSIFHVSETTISRSFKTILPLIRAAIKTAVYFPSAEEIRCNMPKAFKPEFISVRAVMDCTEIQIQKPKCVNCIISTYSHYKGTNTVKFLVCVTPAGFISFVSEGYTGKSSDKFIFNSEKLITKFEPHVDSIMVDKGFAIAQETLEYGIKLLRPTFSQGPQYQFDEDEVIQNTKVSTARVHVERVIQRLKIFGILNHKIEHNILPHINDIFFIISAIVNLTNPILAANKF